MKSSRLFLNHVSVETGTPQADLNQHLGVTKRKELYSRLLNELIKDNETVSYIRNHWDYFEIDISYHGGPGNETYIKDLPLYCAPSQKRIEDMESLGPSELAWQARREWLNTYLRVIEWPWTEAYGYPSAPFFEQFEKVKKLYAESEHKRRIVAWLDETERLFKEKGDKYTDEGAAGRTASQQKEILEEWIKKLRTGI